MFRRLHLQIYLTVIGCLVLVVVLVSALWIGGGRERSERELVGVAERLAALTLPPPGAPDSDQAQAAARLAEALRADLALFGPDGALIFSTRDMGDRVRPPKDGSAWRRRSGGFIGALKLTDGRQLVVAPPKKRHGGPLLGLLAFIGVIALAVAIGAYPFTRRLTRRLVALQSGVDRFGAGDLSARVDIRGRDEVAALGASFNAAAAEIERLTNSRRLLLANASHELRTPLARVRLGAEMLEQKPDPARFTALKQDLAEIEDLIETLLLSSRLDAAPVADRSDRIDLLALAVEEASRYEKCEVTGAAPEIAGDAALLRRMLRNLLDNAAAHGDPPITVDLGAERDLARITVTDSGPGFTDDVDVFEPFQRGKGRQNIAGYGLGLAIVRQIARAHGGDAKMDSEAQGGSVTITLSQN